MSALKPLAAVLLALTGAWPASAAPQPSRVYDLHWTVRVDSIPAGAKEARIWIALPQQRPEQRVSGLEVHTTAPWKHVTDLDFGNDVALVTVPSPPPSFHVELSAHVERDPISGPRPAKLDAKQRALYLRREALVSLGPRIRAIADSVGGTSRSRYDYVLAKMDYDKTLPGWGRGDSERACRVGKGNCTDFHSLFMSLSRVEGVPALFEMGYPTKPAGEQDAVGGYHCWAWFYDDVSSAWVPVDISEADQHPEKAVYYFGHLDADRILFSRGRDVRLPGMQGGPLNYLPAGAYVEVDGRPRGHVTRTISYTVQTPAAEPPR